jgi:hypothetical protein
MKIIISETQYNLLTEQKVKCKCGHSWVKKVDDEHPYLCHDCGWDQKEQKYNKKELKKFWDNYDGEINEKWSEKYKRSIDCSHPKGFSQRAHCQGKKKNK